MYVRGLSVFKYTTKEFNKAQGCILPRCLAIRKLFLLANTD